MRLFLSAGEASGDLHAAQVIKAIKAINPEIEFQFLGGDLMAQAVGQKPLIHYREMAYMGFIDVATHLPQVLSNLKVAKNEISRYQPDAVILIDYPGMNLKLAKYAHSLGIPVHYYIAPKLWAWKEYRVKQIKKYVDYLYSILPFEPQWFADRDIVATYVGNPSVEEVDAVISKLPSREQFISDHNLDSHKPILALVPGSRIGEIKANLPVMDAVAHLHINHQAIIAAAPGIDRNFYSKFSTCKVIETSTLQLMNYANAALVTSGTASLECALTATPQVVCYRAVGWKWAHDLFKHILKIPFVSLPNLITGPITEEERRKQNRPNHVRGHIIPEMLVHHCNPKEVDEQLSPLLVDGVQRQAQLDGYKIMREKLFTKNTLSSETTARAILATLYRY